MKKNKNQKMKLTVLILILVITIGYAILRTGLNINGAANIGSVSWNVHFENYQATQNSNVTPSTVPTIPSGSTTTTELTYVVNLVKPGDTYEFTVEVVNGGSIDATVDIESKLGGNVISQENPLPDYIDYSIKDSNGDAVVEHRLNHGTRKTVTVRVAYKTDINPEDLPEENQQLVFELSLPSEQAPKISPVPAKTGVYTVNTNDSVVIGQPIPNTITTYQTPAQAMAAYNNYPFFLKHVLNESTGVVEESYVGFVITPEMVQSSSRLVAGTYYLRGGVLEDELSVFNENKQVLMNAFGLSSEDDIGIATYDWEHSIDSCYWESSTSGITCSITPDGYTFSYLIEIESPGMASAGIYVNECSIGRSGSSSCYSE